MTPLNNLAYILLTLLCLGLQAKAEVVHWPALCTNGELHIKNKQQIKNSVWLQKFGKTLLSETEYEAYGKSTTVLFLENLEKNERYSLMHFNGNNLEIRYVCSNGNYPTTQVDDGVQTFKKSNLKNNLIWIENLYSDINDVNIEFEDESFKIISETKIRLTSFEQSNYEVPENIKNWSYIKLTPTNKAAFFNLTSGTAEKPVILVPKQTEVDLSAAYFLITPRTGTSDSFTVKIKNQDLINKARELIKNPKQEKILFAKIQKNHLGFNRNWSKPEKSLWSWSTTEVTGFDDLASTACNGAPQQVEDRIDYWINDPGQICFWNYRIKKELTASEVSSGFLKP